MALFRLSCASRWFNCCTLAMRRTHVDHPLPKRITSESETDLMLGMNSETKWSRHQGYFCFLWFWFFHNTVAYNQEVLSNYRLEALLYDQGKNVRKPCSQKVIKFKSTCWQDACILTAQLERRFVRRIAWSAFSSSRSASARSMVTTCNWRAQRWWVDDERQSKHWQSIIWCPQLEDLLLQRIVGLVVVEYMIC